MVDAFAAVSLSRILVPLAPGNSATVLSTAMPDDRLHVPAAGPVQGRSVRPSCARAVSRVQ